MNSPVNQTKSFFNGFLSDTVETTSCVYTKTISLFNLGEKWPLFATIHLDFNEY